jgi:serine protease Do
MAMRKYVVASLTLLPFVLSLSYAAQNLVEQPSQPIGGFWSDESSTGSYLGVDISDVSTERLSALKLKEEKGVEVTMVDQDAPAGKAGMREHDVILTMNGTTVESAAQLRRMIHEMPPGRVVTFGLSRDGQPLAVRVQLGDRHKEFSMMMPNVHVNVPEVHVMPDIDIPAMNMVVVTSSARSGLMVENITPQLGDFFGVKNGNGVLVRSVEKGSRAERAGFHAGDVVVKVNNQPVHDTSDFAHAVRSRNGNSVNVSIVREKKEQSLTLTLPERRDSSWYEEESWDEPVMNAESTFEVSELQDELAELQPQLELASRNARRAAEEMQKTFCEQQKKFQEKSKREAEREQRKFKSEQQKLMQELERMRSEMRRTWLDI